MTVRTKTDGRYYLRFLLIGVAAFGFALWSLYDGAIKYPKQRERALAFQELDQAGRSAQWHEYADQRGWPTDPPGEPKTDVDIKSQYIMAGISSLAGLWLLVVVYRSRGRWIEATESGVESSRGQRVDFDQIVSVNKKRWREKGIATIKYNCGKRRRRLVLDNYKYDRDTTNMILRAVESKVGPDKIIGGPPEPLDDATDEDPSAGSS